MEQKVGNLFSKAERLTIYKSVLRELIEANEYNENIEGTQYPNFKYRYICILLRRYINLLYYQDIPYEYHNILVFFPEVTYKLAVEKFNADSPESITEYGWWKNENGRDYTIPNLRSRIKFMKYIIDQMEMTNGTLKY